MRDPSVRAADLLRITELRDHVQSFVVPAEAGTQRLSLECEREREQRDEHDEEAEHGGGF